MSQLLASSQWLWHKDWALSWAWSCQLGRWSRALHSQNRARMCLWRSSWSLEWWICSSWCRRWSHSSHSRCRVSCCSKCEELLCLAYLKSRRGASSGNLNLNSLRLLTVASLCQRAPLLQRMCSIRSAQTRWTSHARGNPRADLPGQQLLWLESAVWKYYTREK